MQNRSLRADDWAAEALHKYADMVYKLAYAQARNRADADDIFQEVFIRLVKNKPGFESEEHMKAWLIRVTINRCRDLQRAGTVRAYTPLEDLLHHPGQPDEGWQEGQPVLQAVLALPEKYRTVLVLHGLEGQPVDVIASELRLTPSAVKMRLKRGREMLQLALAKEDIHV